MIPKWKDPRPYGFGPDVWAVWTWRRDCWAGHPTKPDCEPCQRGEWSFTLFRPVDQWLYKNHYKIWFWRHNRPRSRARRRIESAFPRLRGES